MAKPILTYRCTACGRVHASRFERCQKCGGTLETVDAGGNVVSVDVKKTYVVTHTHLR